MGPWNPLHMGHGDWVRMHMKCLQQCQAQMSPSTQPLSGKSRLPFRDGKQDQPFQRGGPKGPRWRPAQDGPKTRNTALSRDLTKSLPRGRPRVATSSFPMLPRDGKSSWLRWAGEPGYLPDLGPSSGQELSKLQASTQLMVCCNKNQVFLLMGLGSGLYRTVKACK